MTRSARAGHAALAAMTLVPAAAAMAGGGPTLALEPDETCVVAGETIAVDVVMHDQVEVIAGGQFFLEFDTSKLTLVSVEPAGGPFPTELYECSTVLPGAPPAACTPTVGEIDYAVGKELFGGGTMVDSAMVRLTFTADVECCDVSALVRFRNPQPDPPTRLTNVAGDPLSQTLVDLGSITIDGGSPMIACPLDTTVECDADDQPSSTGTASATDTCDPAPAVTFDDIVTPSACPGSYTIFRTWTATDACGLQSTCEQLVTVVDTTAPDVSGCPADIIADATPGVCGADVGWSAPTVTDNCDPAPVVAYEVDEDDDGAIDVVTGGTMHMFPVGVHRVTVVATDACGNAGAPLPCPADCAPSGGDGAVDVNDLLAALAAWGTPGPQDCDVAPPGGDGAVDVGDLLFILAEWGACPVASTCSFTVTVIGSDDDCNMNMVPDECDIADGRSNDVNGNGIPDECEPDCNSNGVPDDFDILIGTSADCNGNGIPDECEVDCNGNSIPDSCDIAAGTSQDCNGNLIPDECDIAAGTSADCNTNGVPDECDLSSSTSQDCNGNLIPDECDIAAGTSADCNTNGVPDECDLASGTNGDCNGNTIPDECDIAAGTSADCNTNGVPDECDLASGTSGDCNGNTIPDECDIASGTSQDCNGNMVPDECDLAGGMSEDCNLNLVPDECDIASGTSQDNDGNGIPDECEIDCNTNGVPDFIDLLMGTSEDCNANDVPDECDVADGTSADCNGNGTPDECDIASGTSEDLDGDGVPDECGGSCCDNGRPRLLTMRYLADDCSGTSSSQGAGSVGCTDFAPLPDTVFIIASNKQFGAGNPVIWFMGTVTLSETFPIDAAAAGESRLRGNTYIHVLDAPGGTLLQTVGFHTSCSEPLFIGDQFGASRVVGCLGENE